MTDIDQEPGHRGDQALSDDDRHSDGRDHKRGHNPDWALRMLRLNDDGRLNSQVSETELARVLALAGNEDVLDLGSGTGFYTDRIAALTIGTVYALEIVPEMLAHYQQRGFPDNVLLIQGDMTDLRQGDDDETCRSGLLTPAMADIAVTIATWHEIDGRLDVSGTASLLRPQGRLVVIDWRKDPADWGHGPPEHVRFSTEEVVAALQPRFEVTRVEEVGPCMFAVAAKRS